MAKLETVVEKNLPNVTPNERDIVKKLSCTPLTTTELAYFIAWWRSTETLRKLLKETGERPWASPLGSPESKRVTHNYIVAHEVREAERLRLTSEETAERSGFSLEYVNIIKHYNAVRGLELEAQISEVIAIANQTHRIIWAPENDSLLYTCVKRGLSLQTISRVLGASHSAIINRVNHKTLEATEREDVDTWKAMLRQYQREYNRDLKHRFLNPSQLECLVSFRKQNPSATRQDFAREGLIPLLNMNGGIEALESYISYMALVQGECVPEYKSFIANQILRAISEKIESLPELRLTLALLENIALFDLSQATLEDFVVFYVQRNPPDVNDSDFLKLRRYDKPVVDVISREIGRLLECVVNGESGGEKLYDHSLKEILANGLSEKREYEVLKLRFYGDEDGQVKSLREIGVLFGVSYETIRDAEATALEMLRSSSIPTEIREYFAAIADRLSQLALNIVNKGKRMVWTPDKVQMLHELGSRGASSLETIQALGGTPSAHAAQTIRLREEDPEKWKAVDAHYTRLNYSERTNRPTLIRCL